MECWGSEYYECGRDAGAGSRNEDRLCFTDRGSEAEGDPEDSHN